MSSFVEGQCCAWILVFVLGRGTFVEGQVDVVAGIAKRHMMRREYMRWE